MWFVCIRLILFELWMKEKKKKKKNKIEIFAGPLEGSLSGPAVVVKIELINYSLKIKLDVGGWAWWMDESWLVRPLAQGFPLPPSSTEARSVGGRVVVVEV